MASTSTRTRYRPRVVARGGAPARGSRVRWDRFGRVVLVIALFLVLVSYIGPTMDVFDSWRESKSAAARLAELKGENEALVRQAKELEQPAAATVEARKLGLVGPGEQAYVIKGLK
ncbi:MAG: septum formation initiator family protein [Solirubrobacterales bacterium]|nr:septum formation initiator family protein [Solirubrobacterales bacterium]